MDRLRCISPSDHPLAWESVQHSAQRIRDTVRFSTNRRCSGCFDQTIEVVRCGCCEEDKGSGLFLRQNGSTRSLEQFSADGDDDDDVDSADYSVWSGHFGNSFQLYDVAITE
jgi:hypothetical protein